MSIKFPFDKQELKENPDSLIDLVEQLWNENQDLKEKIEKLEGNLMKYTSPHIPSSKQLYPKNKNIKKLIKSGLPTKGNGEVVRKEDLELLGIRKSQMK